MANFTTISLEINTNSTGTPAWRAIGGANTEVRWSLTGTGLLSTASASWPFSLRPGSTQVVTYTYAFTSDTGGFGSYSASAGSADPVAFNDANYLFARWNWDAVGTFASAPIYTAYNDSSHNTPSSRGGGGVLAGHVTDTGATARSYLKANAFGRVTSAGAPAAAPTNDPVVTDGTTGALTPSAGANWLTNYQGLMADLDWIAFPSTPAATTADQWNVIMALFTGPNQSPGTHVPLMTLKYTWS